MFCVLFLCRIIIYPYRTFVKYVFVLFEHFVLMPQFYIAFYISMRYN
nr:MAG TPA: hypothetical protein [Caudoviricetes sp.]